MAYLPPLNGGRINASISGNTTGTATIVSSGTLTLAGGNNITLSQNGNGITLSAFNQSAQTGLPQDVVIAGNTTGTTANMSSGTITLAGGNNITLSQNGNAVTISGAAGGGAAGSNTFGISNLGNTAGISGVISGSALQYLFAGGNNITLSQSVNASSGTVTISAANQSVQTQNVYDMVIAGNTTGTTASVSSGTMTLAGGNNITLSQNGNGITLSAFNQSAQTGLPQDVVIAGNTTGTTANMSSGTITLAGGNNITLSQNGNAVTISGGNMAGIAAMYDGANSISSGTINVSNANGVSLGINGQTLTASVAAQSNQNLSLYGTGNTTQNTSALINASSLVFNGQGNVSVGYSNGSVEISDGGQTLLSYFEPWPIQNAGPATISANSNTSGSVYFVPFTIPQNVAAGYMNVIQSMTFSTGGTSSFNQSVTAKYGIYTRGTGANSTTLSQMTSNSWSFAMTYNNSSMTFSHATATSTSGYGYGSTSSGGLALSQAYTGLKLIQVPISSVLTPGQYWLGGMDLGSSSNFNSGITRSYYGNSFTLTALSPIGGVSSNFSTGTNILPGDGNWLIGMGNYSVAGQTALPGTVAISAMTQNLSLIPFMGFAVS